jgi:hypothetical protein
MIRRLLKYDFKSMLRFWYVAAITTAVLSVIGCGCANVVSCYQKYPEAIIILSWIFLAIVGLSYLAFSIVAIIIVFARFYKNLFTDEGYLTFTLPVKKITVLNSKIISGFSILFATSAVIFTEICLILHFVIIGGSPSDYSTGAIGIKIIWELINALVVDGYELAFSINALLVFLTSIATTLFQLLFTLFDKTVYLSLTLVLVMHTFPCKGKVGCALSAEIEEGILVIIRLRSYDGSV